jgi:hypothetical protein
MDAGATAIVGRREVVTLATIGFFARGRVATATAAEPLDLDFDMARGRRKPVGKRVGLPIVTRRASNLKLAAKFSPNGKHQLLLIYPFEESHNRNWWPERGLADLFSADASPGCQKWPRPA